MESDDIDRITANISQRADDASSAIGALQHCLDQLNVAMNQLRRETPEPDLHDEAEEAPASTHCSHETTIGDAVLCGYAKDRPPMITCKGRRERGGCPLPNEVSSVVSEELTPEAEPLVWRQDLGALAAVSCTRGTGVLTYRVFRCEGSWQAFFENNQLANNGTLEECMAACNEHEANQ